MAGLRIRLTGWSARTTSDTVLRRRLITACHGRCLYIGRASACAFTTTERALRRDSNPLPSNGDLRRRAMLLPVMASSLPRCHT
ncbi:hypothetical protein [Enterobacter phage BUCT554]|nr:hypothetical protein [Enterobacter phage BUCT554]